ncbi:MAG: cysteine hydrolase [Acidobacteriota bacterium]|nr:cysteine hydrolase [Acidobacteriota bacterium]
MRQALLVMDMQNGIVTRVGDRAPALLANLERALAVARERATPVIFVRVAFRRGAPEISERNHSFSALAAGEPMDEDAESTQIHPRLTPRESEPLVTKRRVSAFTGSDLEVILRSFDVDHLVLTGIATSGVVLSTIRQAADMDFRLTVLADGCADADPEVHRVLTTKVFPRQARVVSVDEWIAVP